MQGSRINVTRVTMAKMFKYGTSMLLSALALLGFIIIVNYLFGAKTNYTDITRNRIHSLTDNTKVLLEKIDFPVKVNAFYLSSNQMRIVMILRGYQQLNKNITYEIIDPLTDPLTAQKYGVPEPGTLVFEARGAITTLKPLTDAPTQSEREITLMLYRILTSQSRTAYFTAGHGELSIENPNYDGLSRVRSRLLEQGYFVESLNLQTVTSLKPEESIVIVAEPKTPFSDNEMEVLMNYLDNGGSIMVLGSPPLGATAAEQNLPDLLLWHGLNFGNNFVYETASNRTTTLGPTAPLCRAFEFSEIMEGLENQNIIFPFVCSIDTVYTNEDTKYIRLLASSESSWAETDLNSAREIQKGTRPSRDEKEQKGPIVVAFATESYIEIPVADSLHFGAYRPVSARSAFFGNARFTSNMVLAQFPANLTLFLNTVNWITRNELIMTIEPRSVQFTPIELLQTQRRLINWLTLFLYPAVIAITGFVVWLRKR